MPSRTSSYTKFPLIQIFTLSHFTFMTSTFRQERYLNEFQDLSKITETSYTRCTCTYTENPVVKTTCNQRSTWMKDMFQ